MTIMNTQSRWINFSYFKLPIHNENDSLICDERKYQSIFVFFNPDDNSSNDKNKCELQRLTFKDEISSS